MNFTIYQNSPYDALDILKYQLICKNMLNIKCLESTNKLFCYDFCKR